MRRRVPETFNRDDWPRLVAQAVNANIAAIEAGGSTSLELDGGDAGGSDGSVMIDGGGA